MALTASGVGDSAFKFARREQRDDFFDMQILRAIHANQYSADWLRGKSKSTVTATPQKSFNIEFTDCAVHQNPAAEVTTDRRRS